MFKYTLLLALILPLISCEDKNPKLFTDPSKIEADVGYVQNSMDQVKGLLNQLDPTQFGDVNQVVDQIQQNLNYAKLQFDADKNFDLLGEKIEDLRKELSQLGPKLRGDLESFWRKEE